MTSPEPRPASEEPAREEPAREEPAKHEPAKHEPAKNEPAKNEPDWAAVEDALERYFLAREDGEPIDVMTACHGSAALAEQVLTVLGNSPDMVVETTAQSVPSTLDSFGDFDVVQQIGKGGMGTVYLAVQRSLGRQVALKVLDGIARTMPSARTRMRREAELTALLEHPNIIPVYAVGEVGDAPFIAMKYIEGPSLVEMKQPWSPEAVAKLGIALADGLDSAHLQGIVHRDVKPANILMDGDSPVLVDFGLARGQSDPTLTQEGKVAGTLRYMAPERLDANTHILDPRVDIYGLGATLYELLTARELFADQNPTTLVRSVLVREPIPMRLRGRHHDLETIVMRALAKEPRRRFATAREMAEDLRRYLSGEPVTSRRLTVPQRVLRKAQRHPRSAALVLATVLLLSIAAGMVASNASAAAADRQRRLAYAEQLSNEGRHLRAHEELTLVAEAFAGDEEVSRALSLASAQVAIDDLLVAIANRSFVVDPSVTARLHEQPSNEAARNPQLALARAIALHQVDGEPQAELALLQVDDAVRASRTGVAVSSLLAGTSLPWTLPAYATPADHDDVLLTCMALRVAGASEARVLDELSLAPSTGSARLLFLEAVVRWDLGQQAIAEGILKGLAEQVGTPLQWRWLAKVQASFGKFATAKVSLQRAGSNRPRSADRYHYQIELGLAAAADDQARTQQLIAELRALPDPHVEVIRLLAEYDGKTSREGAAAAVQCVLDLAALDRLGVADRDLYLATAMEIDGWHLPHSVEEAIVVEAIVEEDSIEEASAVEESTAEDSTAEDNAAAVDSKALRAQHQQFLSRWRERAATIQYAPARRRADHWLACSMTIGGDSQDRAKSLAMLQELCQNESVRPETVMFYAFAAFTIDDDFASDDRDGPLVARMYRSDALHAVDSLLANHRHGYLLLRDTIVQDLQESGALLSQALGDSLGCARRRLAFSPQADAQDSERRKSFASWIDWALEQFARGN